MPTSDTLDCPRGTTPDEVSISDQGWDYPERYVWCLRPDRYADGPAIEYYEGAEGRGSTKSVGRYAHRVPIGTWTQYDVKTGQLLATYTLDAGGNGIRDFRDQVGHRLVGALRQGERDGVWTTFDASGKPVATEVFDRGKFVRGSGAVPWSPPMMDPDDACPTEPEDRDPAKDLDGCPEPPRR
jgi:hypothetical protein